MDLSDLWKTVLAEIELSVSKGTYHTQFRGSQLLSLVNGVATVGFPNSLMRGMAEARYYSLVKSILDNHTKQNVSLVFAISPKPLSPKDAGPLFSQTLRLAGASEEGVAKKLHVRADSTFENFAVSTSNQIAYAAATAVAKNPGAAYNPLFLYGGVGVGKTHLMHAIANSVLARKPAARIVYCMGEEFLNDIVEAIQTKTARQFKQKYRSAEILFVDDVQFIAGKPTSQEEFFHTFNAVHREGGQIVLTSDRPPGEIAKLEDRLRSRFEGGLIVDIAAPDFELRAAIVNIKAQNMGLFVPPEAGQMIAANVTDARAIEGFLQKLSATTPGPITSASVSGLLGQKPQEGGLGKNGLRHSPQELLELVASFYHLKPTALKGPKRDRPIARPRQLVMYLCKTELGLTYSDIGGILGGRDHTTIMHGVDTITHELTISERLRNDVEGIHKLLFHLSTN